MKKENNKWSEIIKHVAKDENLIEFLKKYNIAKIEEIVSKKFYNKNDSREVVTIDAKEENFIHRTKIMIDLRFGQPSVNQVNEALYGLGNDCDIKIICYTNDSNNNDKGIPVFDEYLVASLIGELQSHNVPIALFSVDSDSGNLEYADSYQNWYSVNRLKSHRIPKKERFMADTFWGVYFDSFNSTFYEPWSAFKGCYNENNGKYIIYIDGVFYGEIKLFWDAKGVRYEAKQISESDEYMKKVLDVIMPDLKTKYGEDAVEFENVVGRLPRLYIKYSDKPFNWLFTATPREIAEFAEKMYFDAWGLRWMIEGTIEELYEKVPA